MRGSNTQFAIVLVCSAAACDARDVIGPTDRHATTSVYTESMMIEGDSTIVVSGEYECHWHDEPPPEDPPDPYITGWECHWNPGGGDPEPIEDPGDGDGGGGSSPEDCDPRIPGCILELRSQDYDALNATGAFLRATFADSIAGRVCAELRAKFDDMLSSGSVKRGSPDIPDAPMPDHGAAYWNGVIHIDQDYLDFANDADAGVRQWYRWTLAQTVLHEAAHALGYPSHGSDEGWGNFRTFPYTHTNGGSGAETCVLPYSLA